MAALRGLNLAPSTYHTTSRCSAYYRHCLRTVQGMVQRLGWDPSRLQAVFQSRFGREEWLQPYAEETVQELAASGVKNLVVIIPGFVADCLETLEEVALEMKETFLEHGGH